MSSGASAARPLYVWLNTREAPFNNVKLRQAVAASLDRREIIETVLLGRGKLTTGIPPATLPYVLAQEEVAGLPFYKQDYAQVKRLLAEAGHPNGFEFTLKTSPHSPDYVPAAQVMQRQLAKAGITLKIEQLEWGTLLKQFRGGAPFQALALARIWYPDPEGYVFDTLWSKGSINVGKYESAESDRLLIEQRATVDPARRGALGKGVEGRWGGAGAI